VRVGPSPPNDLDVRQQAAAERCVDSIPTAYGEVTCARCARKEYGEPGHCDSEQSMAESRYPHIEFRYLQGQPADSGQGSIQAFN